MGDFNPVPGTTTNNGQIGTHPNRIAPEKRVLSSMTQAIAVKNEKPYIIIRSPGDRTINTVFQTVLNVLSSDMQIDKAIEAMKIHHQWLPDAIKYEKNLMSPDTKRSLKQWGITYDSKFKVYIGYSDSSSPDGGAVGY